MYIFATLLYKISNIFDRKNSYSISKRLGKREGFSTRVLFQKHSVEVKEYLVDPILFIDLMVMGLKSGSSVTKIFETLSEVTGNSNYQKIAKKLLLGLSWKEAYKNTCFVHDLNYVQIFKVLEQNWCDGTSPIGNLQQAKTRISRERKEKIHVNIAKLGTKLTLPLGVCYLPSFISLGLLPIVISSSNSIVF